MPLAIMCYKITAKGDREKWTIGASAWTIFPHEHPHECIQNKSNDTNLICIVGLRVRRL